MPGRDHRCQIEFCPAVATRAAAVEAVVAFVQAGDAAEFNHGPMLTPDEAHRMSRVCTNSGSHIRFGAANMAKRTAMPELYSGISDSPGV